MKKHRIAPIATLALACLLTAHAEASQPSINEQINAIFATQQNGTTLRELTEELDKLPPSSEAAYARGTARFLIAFEGLLQGAHRHGFLQTFREVGPMMTGRMQVIAWTANDNPAETTPQLINLALRSFIVQLADANRVLAEIDQDFQVEIEIPAIRFDIDADGEASSAESLRSLFALIPEIGRWDPEQRRTVFRPVVPEDLVIAFDRGDAEWMRGYAHALSGFAEVILAHDYTEWFDRTGFVLFPKAVTTHDSLPGSTWFIETVFGAREPAPFDATDLFAMIGNLHLPIKEPERMTRALEHFRKTVQHARTMWKLYDAETDNDREWIPNPRQTAAFSEVVVSIDMRDAWLALIDEADAVLSGRKLLRFWRGNGTKGIDLVAVFTEPRDFDFLYWLQGSAATPYLREGEFTAPGTWAQIRRVTDRRYFRFSFWFN